MYIAAEIASGGLSGGLGSVIAGGDFWRGAEQGVIATAYNHAVHGLYNKINQDEANPWDTNKDGKLQKKEADNWYLNGKGKPISVDNSKIDWSGLELPQELKKDDIFAISTTEAFFKLPFETAATYGGTVFEKTGRNTAKVLDQLYHYKMRSYNNVENFVRNVLTKIGKPSGIGQPYMINYKNPTLRFSKRFSYMSTIIVPGLMYYIPEKKKIVRYLFKK